MKYDKEIDIKVNSRKIRAVINYCTNGDYKSKSTLILAHGFMGSMSGGGSSIILANNVSDLVNVLRFNFSDSEKLSDRVLELKGIVDFVKKNINKNIVLLGRSLGGLASLIVASADEDVFALSLWATPRNLKNVFKNVIGYEKYAKLINGESVRIKNEKGSIIITPEMILDAYQYDLIEFLKEWNSRPVLILHGADDNIVKVSQARENYADISSKDKKIVVLKKCGHSFKDCDSEIIKVTKDWLRNIL